MSYLQLGNSSQDVVPVLEEGGGRGVSRGEDLLEPGYLLPCTGQLKEKEELKC